MDMDTLAEYDELRTLATCREVPTRAECEAILADRRVETSIVLHSRVVARVAERITNALVRSGMTLNAELVLAGAMLHDLAKGEPDHAAVGAGILHLMDFPQVAAIVSVHTDLDFSGDIDERAIVYLADKLVRGEEIVTVDQRFQTALERFRDDPAALSAAQKRNATVKAVAMAVETRIGVPLASVVNEAAQR
jgi:HD superfamily phosphohydrolase YqeK